MNTSRKSLLVVGTLILAIALLITRLSRPNAAPPAPTPEAADTTPAQTDGMNLQSPPPSPTPQFSMLHWRQGDGGSYQLQVAVRLSDSPDKLGQHGETRIGGKLCLVVLEANPQQIKLGAAMRDSFFLAGGERVGSMEELFNATGAILTLSPEGDLLSLAFQREIPAEDRDTLRLAYGGLQFTVRNLPIYQVDENLPGLAAKPFHATYQRLDVSRIRKTRSIPDEEEALLGNYHRIIDSDFSATVGNSFYLSELSGFEDSLIGFNGQTLSSRISISLRQIESIQMPSALSDLVANPASRSVFTELPSGTAGKSISQAMREQALAAKWGSAPFSQVLDPVEAAATGSMQDAIKPLHDYEEWLRVHAEDGPALVLETLQTMQANNALSGLLLHGLAQAGTPSSRDALASIMKQSEAFPPTVAIQTAVSAGGVTTPDEALRSALIPLLDSTVQDEAYRLSDSALFAYARLAKDDQSCLELLKKRVEPWLDSNASQGDTLKALGALSNAALDDARFVHRAAELTRATDSDTRLAATEYLAALPNSTVAASVMEELLSDPDERVRSVAEMARSK